MNQKIIKAAIHAYEQGWAPIPIKQGTKRPTQTSWGETRYKTEKEIEEAFKNSNLGVVLGDASGGLIDIDLDSPEAQSLASGFLPMTRMVHGRDSFPKSHYWYRVVGWHFRVEQFFDPVERDKQLTGEEYDTERLTLIELRGNGGQTLLPPSIHPSGETYAWHDGWHPPAVVPHQELARQVRWLAAASLLARYWPGAGKRHAASMALAGGLLRLEIDELSRYAEAFVASVALAAGDEEGMDRQDDVASTRKRVEKGVKVKGWASLSKIIDRRVITQVIEWLRPEEEEEDPHYGDGTMTRSLLTDYMTGEIEPQRMLLKDIIYAERVTWFQGEPGKGKTIFSLWITKECIEQGYRVMMLDEESGARMTGERLAALGAKPHEVDERFFYYPFSSVNVLEPEHRQAFNNAMQEAQPDLIIFDSVADIIAQAGLKENENDDITALMKYFATPLTRQGIAALFIDHMVKSDVGSSWARGAGQKKSKTDASWTFNAIREFDKNTIGRVSLKRSKDRLGQLPATHIFAMGGDGEGNISVNTTEVIKDLSEVDDQYAQRIIEYLKENAVTPEEGLTSSDLYSQVKGKRDHLLKGMKWIEENKDESPIEILVRGNSKVWYYAGDVEIDWASVAE